MPGDARLVWVCGRLPSDRGWLAGVRKSVRFARRAALQVAWRAFERVGFIELADEPRGREDVQPVRHWVEDVLLPHPFAVEELALLVAARAAVARFAGVRQTVR